MRLFLNKTVLGIIITLVFSNIVLADQTIDRSDIYWFSSNTSSLLNRSSIELATKHLRRGIRSAQQALAKELNSMDQIIANHNLCIAYLMSDQEILANQYCLRAYELAQVSYRVVKVRGAFRLQENDTESNQQINLSPVQVISNNIERQRLRTGMRLTQLTE